jgi:hypothetical protein
VAAAWRALRSEFGIHQPNVMNATPNTMNGKYIGGYGRKDFGCPFRLCCSCLEAALRVAIYPAIVTGRFLTLSVSR